MQQRDVIIDIETSGLARGRWQDGGRFAIPLEIAAVVIDEHQNSLATWSRVLTDANSADASVFAFDEEAMRMHQATGLFSHVASGQGSSIEVATYDLIAFLANNGVNVEARGQTIMVGNNPDFDRAFLDRFFPAVASIFHYRAIDVSTMREVAARRAGVQTARLKSAMSRKENTKHRALGDCLQALEELRCYSHAMDGALIAARIKKEEQ